MRTISIFCVNCGTKLDMSNRPEHIVCPNCGCEFSILPAVYKIMDALTESPDWSEWAKTFGASIGSSVVEEKK